MVTNWRKEYYTQAIRSLKDIRGPITEMPQELKLPISSKQCMFEFGGSKHATGIALVVATASGFPNTAIVLHNRHANGLHVSSRVWPGTLVGVASHSYGVINIGIYKVCPMSTSTEYVSGGLPVVTLELLAGATRMEYSVAMMHHWYSHLEKKYPGIRRLAQATGEKLMDYRCTTPIYIEPFRALRRYTKKDADFSKLMTYTDLEIPAIVKQDTPQHEVLSSSMKEMRTYANYGMFEQALLKECDALYVAGHPYIYVYFCHHYQEDKFVTQAFVAYQEKENGILRYLRRGYIYLHIGYEQKRSYDFESFIKSNYNPTYMAMLIDTESGGIGRLLESVARAKDGCVSVPLKYSWCTKRYAQ